MQLRFALCGVEKTKMACRRFNSTCKPDLYNRAVFFDDEQKGEVILSANSLPAR